ncbi:MAG: ChbG/HpnK family deacetylase [Chloroflexi bacterium]|nr:ChbG/HpnK family deacetylase [Chloroflexota bacterium]
MRGSRASPDSTTGSRASGDWERRLIVNADDFGLSPAVNRGILQAHRDGPVTSASLMANLPAAADAVALWQAAPSLGLGLHLNLTADRPICPPDQVPSLRRADGRFFALGELLARLTTGRTRVADVERELAAQVERALALGGRLDHLDGHHHIHVHPRVAPVVLRLARRYGVKAVRAPAEGVAPIRNHHPGPRGAIRVLGISLFGRLFAALARRAGLRTTAHFRGMALGTGFGPVALQRELRQLPRGLTELMVHPGRLDDEAARFTTFTVGRDRELAALVASETREALQTVGARLVRWSDLADA